MDIHGTIHNGQIALPHPLDLPEGTVVLVTTNLSTAADHDDDLLGDSPEAIARWIREFDGRELPEMSDEEYAEFEALLKEDKRRELEQADVYHEKLMKDIFP